MPNFFKNLFSSSSSLSQEKKKISKSRQDVDQVNSSMPSEFNEKEYNVSYDTRKKMFTSRSGRMKNNQKIRGTLSKGLFGEGRYEEKSNIGYHVHGQAFTQEFFQITNDDIRKSMENIYKMAKEENDDIIKKRESVKKENDNEKPAKASIDTDHEIEEMFKSVIETTF